MKYIKDIGQVIGDKETWYMILGIVILGGGTTIGFLLIWEVIKSI